MSFATSGNPYGQFEKQTLTPDNVTDTFLLNYRPGSSGALLVVYGGVVQEPGSSYSIIDGGQRIRFSFVPVAGELLYILFLGRELSVPSISGNYPIHDIATGDGVLRTFTLSAIPAEAALMVYLDGSLQLFSEDWTLSGNKVTFVTAPPANARLDFYIHGVEILETPAMPDSSVDVSKLKLNYLSYATTGFGVLTFNGMRIANNSLSISTAKYVKIGNLIKLRVKFSATFTDTPDKTVRFTLPSTITSGPDFVSGSAVLSTSSSVELGILRWGAVNAIDVVRANGVEYEIGKEWTFEIVFEYEVA